MSTNDRSISPTPYTPPPPKPYRTIYEEASAQDDLFKVIIENMRSKIKITADIENMILTLKKLQQIRNLRMEILNLVQKKCLQGNPHEIKKLIGSDMDKIDNIINNLARLCRLRSSR